jgi:hypothetical protein
MTVAQKRTLGPRQWAIILLTVATALIHLVLAFQFQPGPDPIFILNAIGYLGLLALLYLPISSVQKYHTWVRWALMAFTAATLIGWLFVGVGSPFAGQPLTPVSSKAAVAYVDKAIEIALIVLLWMDR